MVLHCALTRAATTPPPQALTDAALRSRASAARDHRQHDTVADEQLSIFFGREPRLLDTLYVGSAEAFSKPVRPPGSSSSFPTARSMP